jgi:hypothetical protein
MSDKAQAEQIESALPPIADMKTNIDFRRSWPILLQKSGLKCVRPIRRLFETGEAIVFRRPHAERRI